MASRVFYRIVATDPPTLDDFTANQAKGKAPPNDDPLTLWVWDGISVYATYAQARRKARDFPRLGRYISKLEIPEGAPLRVERTFRRSPGHHTVWGEPATLLRYLVAVVPA